MTNELVFFTIALLSFIFIQVASSVNKSYLLAGIILNYLLIAVFGAKLISLFGFTTNVGNVFYVTVFFATQVLTERYGKKEALRSIWLGVASAIFFMLMAQYVIFTTGLPQTRLVNNAIDVLFNAAPRVAIASAVAYVVSQFVNISLFTYINNKTQGKFVYLRVNIANIAGQAIDSIIFFTIAFYGVIPLPLLLQASIVGYILKVAAGALSTPFFYLYNTSSKEK